MKESVRGNNARQKERGRMETYVSPEGGLGSGSETLKTTRTRALLSQIVQCQAALSDLTVSPEIKASPTELMLQSLSV